MTSSKLLFLGTVAILLFAGTAMGNAAAYSQVASGGGSSYIHFRIIEKGGLHSPTFVLLCHRAQCYPVQHSRNQTYKVPANTGFSYQINGVAQFNCTSFQGRVRSPPAGQTVDLKFVMTCALYP